MRKHSSTGLYAFVLAAVVLYGSPAAAQFTSRAPGDPATGEKFHIEASAVVWNPSADMQISSESLGIKGDTINFKRDLGLTDTSVRPLSLILRPAKKHKFRYQFIPLKYDQSAVISRSIVFNGQNFTVGIPVNSSLNWKTHQFSYEYDFVSLNRGFGGFILEVKQTDVVASLESPSIRRETAHAAGPIPALGGIFRAYVMPNISISGEVKAFKLPNDIIKNSEATYIDTDFYGTVNFTNYIGAQLGYRTLHPSYVFDDDRGDFKLNGFYFGVVARY